MADDDALPDYNDGDDEGDNYDVTSFHTGAKPPSVSSNHQGGPVPPSTHSNSRGAVPVLSNGSAVPASNVGPPPVSSSLGAAVELTEQLIPKLRRGESIDELERFQCLAAMFRKHSDMSGSNEVIGEDYVIERIPIKKDSPDIYYSRVCRI